MAHMSVEVRRIQPGDGPLFKEVRLAALLDAPYAFARSHDEEYARPEEEWEQFAVDRSTGSEAANWFAFVDGEAAGLVGAYRVAPEPFNLVSMWTHPDHRAKGVGERLVQTVLDFAGGGVVELWVTRGNDPAQRLYERCGFEVTTEVQALPSDPCKEEVRMRRPAGE